MKTLFSPDLVMGKSDAEKVFSSDMPSTFLPRNDIFGVDFDNKW
jgi:hypothetical protein